MTVERTLDSRCRTAPRWTPRGVPPCATPATSRGTYQTRW